MSDTASRLSEQELAELCALADGTLPADRRAAVEARVATSPELQELVRRQRLAVTATQALASEPEPPSLHAAIEARRRAPDTPRTRPRRRVLRLAAAGALAAAVATVLAVVLAGGPGGPTVAEAAALAAQPATGSAPSPAKGSETTLALDVEGVTFPDLARSFGWRAVGVRRDTVDGRNATVVYYEKSGRQIAYVIVAGEALSRPSGGQETDRGGVRFQTLEIGGRRAVTWRRAGHTCILIGAATRDELLGLASWKGGGTRPY